MQEISKVEELLKNLDDEGILLDAFYQEEDINLRMIILKKIKNIELIDKASISKLLNIELRFIAIEKCSRYALIQVIEDTTDNVNLRKRAIEILEDDDYNWYQLFQRETNNKILKILIEQKIKSQRHLTSIVMGKNKNEIYRQMALEKISDEGLLIKIAIKPDLEDYIKEKALSKITNIESFREIVEKTDISNATHSFLIILLVSLNRCNDKKTIAKIFLNMRNKFLIEDCIKYVDDKELLELIYNNATYWYARAVAKVTLEQM